MCNTTHLLYKLSNKYKVTLGLYLRLSPEYQRLKSTALAGKTGMKELVETLLWSFDSLNPRFLTNLKGQVMMGSNQILLQDREWEKHHRFSLTGREIKEMKEFV